MKKKLWLLVAMAMLLALTGCSKANGETASDAQTPKEKVVEEVIPVFDARNVQGLALFPTEDNSPVDKDILEMPHVLGTTQDLTAWKADFQATLLSMVHIRFNGNFSIDNFNMETEEDILIPAYILQEMLDYIENTPATAFPAGSEWESPAEEDSTFRITALDESEAVLWDAYYNSSCFRFVKDGKVYAFSMESTDTYDFLSGICEIAAANCDA